MVYGFFGKKSSGGAATRTQSETLATRDKSAIKYKNIPHQQLAEELHRPIIRKLKK